MELYGDRVAYPQIHATSESARQAKELGAGTYLFQGSGVRGPGSGVRGPGSGARGFLRLSLARHLLPLLASLRKAYSNGLLAALHCTPFAAGSALCLASLVAVHLVLHVFACAARISSLFSHLPTSFSSP
jgi:hypothetical protein